MFPPPMLSSEGIKTRAKFGYVIWYLAGKHIASTFTVLGPQCRHSIDTVYRAAHNTVLTEAHIQWHSEIKFSQQLFFSQWYSNGRICFSFNILPALQASQKYALIVPNSRTQKYQQQLGLVHQWSKSSWIPFLTVSDTYVSHLSKYESWPYGWQFIAIID